MPRSINLMVVAIVLTAMGCAHSPLQAGGAVSDVPGLDPDSRFPPGTIEVNFLSKGERLNGFLYTAAGEGPHPTVVLLHGYPGNEKNLDVAQDLRSSGFNVLFFHYRGAWGSGGEFSFRNVIEDVASALAMLRVRAPDYRVDPNNLLLIGHSMGGFASLQGAANDPAVQCAAGLAAWDIGAAAAVFQTSDEIRQGWWDYSETLAMLRGWSGDKAITEIMDNADAYSLRGIAPRLRGKDILLLAADRDAAVPAAVFHDPMVEVYAADPDINLTHSVLSGDHSFSWTREALSTRVVRWAERCIGQ